MPQDGNRMTWDAEAGTFTLIGEGKEERVFTMSHDFIEKFKEEILQTAGKSTIKIAMRKLLEKLGASSGENSEANWSSFEKYNDRQLLPVLPEAGTHPDLYDKWDGSTRSMLLLPDIEVDLWSVRAVQAFKEVMADIMTEKGATALLNGSFKKAGIAIGAAFVKYFGWKDLQDAVDNVDEMYRRMVNGSGWGRGSAIVRTGPEGKHMILFKIRDCYEADKITSERPICTINASLLNGVWNSFTDILGDQAAEAREVRCSAKGDDYCAFAVKFKDKSAPPLDWTELEAEWQAIDTA